MNEVTPASLKDAPALIQAVFPAQKVSFEAQSERKAVAAQTLMLSHHTGLKVNFEFNQRELCADAETMTSYGLVQEYWNSQSVESR